MKTHVDRVLAEESVRFGFRFACDDCAHWTGQTCSNAWPTRVPNDPLVDGIEVTFCKEFELGAPDGVVSEER